VAIPIPTINRLISAEDSIHWCSFVCVGVSTCSLLQRCHCVGGLFITVVACMCCDLLCRRVCTSVIVPHSRRDWIATAVEAAGHSASSDSQQATDISQLYF